MEGASPTPSATPSATAAVANKPLVFAKMEALVREMQDPETGVPIRSQKLFLTSIPSAFMGYDLVEWLLDRLDIEDSAEAIHLSNLLCQYGYFFPVGETRSLMVKDDSSLYRFQTPYYWASQNHSADSTDYAIYLSKRLSRNKQKYGLEDYEVEAYNKLKKGLQHKWDFILMQAEEQVRLSKDRKKGDKIVTDSQERAYWRVFRPPPGYTNYLENAPIPDRNNMANRVKKKTVESTKKEIDLINRQIERTRLKVSVASESLISHFDTYFDYDYLLVPPQPSNPWLTDDITFWILNEDFVDVATEKRVRRWSISFAELVADPTGIAEFTSYLRKEYCHENIRFWQAVTDLRYGPTAEVANKVDSIFEEFLKAGAPCEINIDGKTMEITQQLMKTPTRYTYDLAAEHVYVLLLKKDCYPRFLRSENYKNLLSNAIQPSQKKKFFSFGPGKKKPTAISSANSVSLQAQTPQPLKRGGSDELAPGGIPLVTSEGHLGIGAALGLLQPRLDCDQPYRGDLAAGIGIGLTAEIVLASSSDRGATLAAMGQSMETSEVCPWESTGDDAICPWESPTNDSVCPWENAPIPQPPTRVQQLSKPRPPDRSQSVEVNPSGSLWNPSGSHKLQFPSLGTALTPITGDSSLEGSPVKGEKARSLENPPIPGESAHVPSNGTTLKTLAPSAFPYLMMAERRASEGVVRAYKGVCPIEVLKPPSKYITKETEGETVVEQKGKESMVNVLQETEVSRVVEVLESKESPSEVAIDLTVRSGHLPCQLSLSSDFKLPSELPSRSSQDVRSTKVIDPESSPALKERPKSMKDITSHSPKTREKRRVVTQSSVKFKPEVELAIAGPSKRDTRPAIGDDPDAKKEENVVAPWEDVPSQKTSDVCPWEDEESCKVDTPFVKTYTTFGYL